MRKLSTLIAGALAVSIISSCEYQQQSPENLNSALIDMKQTRASVTSEHKLERKGQTFNTDQHAAITDHSELVKDKLTTVLTLEKNADVRLNIIDQKGKIVQSELVPSTIGLNQYELDFSELVLGEYYVVLVSDDTYHRYCVAKVQ